MSQFPFQILAKKKTARQPLFRETLATLALRSEKFFYFCICLMHDARYLVLKRVCVSGFEI